MPEGIRTTGVAMAAIISVIFALPTNTWGQLSKSRDNVRGARRAAAEPQVAYAAVPVRPTRTPIDVADVHACLRELAELASFPLLFNDVHDYRPNAVGQDCHYFQPDKIEQLDRVVRFDRLLQSNDPKFREVVKQVRRISLDAWRVNRAAFKSQQAVLGGWGRTPPPGEPRHNESHTEPSPWWQFYGLDSSTGGDR